jgi:hypothetical protein
MKRINNLFLVKTISELSIIKIIKNHIEMEGEESSFLLILGDSTEGGS